MKKIKLLHIQLLPVIAGAQNVMLKILENLEREKYDIFVISKPGGPLLKKLAEMKIEHIPVKSLRRKISILDIKAFFDIFRICRNYKFDIVHTHSSKTGFLGRIAARLAGVEKIIHTSHGFPFNEFQSLPTRLFYMLCETFAAFFCDRVVFVNQHDRDYAVKHKLVAAKKAITIFNGIKLPEKIKTKKNSDRFLIGSSFRFWQQKNPLQTIEAAISVCQKNPVIDFIFLGDGELLSECKEMVFKADLSNRIKFPGWVENVSEHLNEFDVFLLYSKWEGLPVSILEAMSFGLPIIASDIVGNRELVDEGNGRLICLNQVDKLVELLITLPTRNSELKKWGKESRKRVEKKFSVEEFSKEYKKVYETKI